MTTLDCNNNNNNLRMYPSPTEKSTQKKYLVLKMIKQ